MPTIPKTSKSKTYAIPKVAYKKKGLLAAEALLRTVQKNYAPDAKLPPERVLAQEMGVSRNTLRQGIAALSLAGIVEMRHSQGNFIVMDPNFQQARTRLQNIFETSGDLFEVLDARIALEPGIARLACKMATEADIVDLEARLADLAESVSRLDAASYSLADKGFHRTIARATQNALILQALNPLLVPLHIPLWEAMKSGLNSKEMIATRIDEHRLIFEAIKNRNEDDAGRLLREHLRASKQRFLVEEE